MEEYKLKLTKADTDNLKGLLSFVVKQVGLEDQPAVKFALYLTSKVNIAVQEREVKKQKAKEKPGKLKVEKKELKK